MEFLIVLLVKMKTISCVLVINVTKELDVNCLISAFIPLTYKCAQVSYSKASLKWLTIAMPLLENSKIQERDNTRERLEREKREPREIWRYSRWPIIV